MSKLGGFVDGLLSSFVMVVIQRSGLVSDFVENGRRRRISSLGV